MKVSKTFVTVLLLCCTTGVGSAVADKWSSTRPLLLPGPAGSFDEVAVKDPSIVQVNGQWHVFYTARSKRAYSVGHVAAERLEDLNAAPRTRLTQIHGAKDPYAAAPQVFFFTPGRCWYLVFQTRDANYQPAFSTTDNIEDPASWSAPESLLKKDEPEKWIDFWVICDETRAFLFYTRAHRDVWYRTATLEDFPRGFGPGHRAFGPVHEAVHVYRAAGRGEYHLLYECADDRDLRHFSLAIAPRLDGPWTVRQSPWLKGGQLVFGGNEPPWTAEVSHGEFLRTGSDQFMDYAPEHPRLLIQGLREGDHTGSYELLPWSLGLVERIQDDIKN